MTQTLTRRQAVGGAAAGLAATAATRLGGAAQSATPAAGIDAPSGPITVFVAKTIITMDPDNPTATHVAVQDGRILGAGTLDDVAGWGEYTLDETFKDLVLTPGFIEAHSHPYEGLVGEFLWVGYYDRRAVDGSVIPGTGSFDELLAKLRAEDAKLTDPNAPLIAIGFDPIFFAEDPNAPTFDAAFLDQVSSTRQIAIWWLNSHDMTVNSAALKANGITSATKVPGVLKDASGNPTGQLNETPAMGLAKSIFGILLAAGASPEVIRAFARFGLNAGCTTVSDLAASTLADASARKTWLETTGAADFPVRVAAYVDPTIPGANITPEDLPGLVAQQIAENTEKYIVAGVKLVLDGSIQAYTAKLNWPYYYKGPNDQMELLITPEQAIAWTVPLHKAGIQVSFHCNGDAATDVYLQAVEAAQRAQNWPDHRHTCQHSQLTSQAQYRKMKELAGVVNIFSNHIWYYGDQHYEITVGPERAVGMEATGTARDLGIPFSLHTDPITTPLGPLMPMWCAVNRITPKGRQFAEEEKITAEEALRAVTLGAAFLLKLDDRLGSIETGKWADFTVLEESPLEVDPTAIRDITVWGTVLGGVKQQAAGVAPAYQLPK